MLPCLIERQLSCITHCLLLACNLNLKTNLTWESLKPLPAWYNLSHAWKKVTSKKIRTDDENTCFIYTDPHMIVLGIIKQFVWYMFHYFFQAEQKALWFRGSCRVVSRLTTHPPDGAVVRSNKWVVSIFVDIKKRYVYKKQSISTKKTFQATDFNLYKHTFLLIVYLPTAVNACVKLHGC